jgi:hypothetical protein
MSDKGVQRPVAKEPTTYIERPYFKAIWVMTVKKCSTMGIML